MLLTQLNRALDAKKALDICTIPLGPHASLAEYLVVASGTSAPHVQTLAEHVLRALYEHGVTTPHVEGLREGNWVIIDTGDIMVHIFQPEHRAKYNLEKMWVHQFGQRDTTTESTAPLTH